ncbi:MAG: AraC family transcriptional regulator [Spirochaetaceae bacterium]
MKNLKKWFSKEESNNDLQINGIGIKEEMNYSTIDRPVGTGDILIMFFHQSMSSGVPSDKYYIAESSVIYWKPDMGHYYHSEYDTWIHSWIHLSGNIAECIFQNLKITPGIPQSCSMFEIIPWLELLYKEMVNNFTDKSIIESLIKSIVKITNRNTNIENNLLENNPMLDIRRYLQEHYNEKITLESLAQIANLSAPYLCSLFKKEFGETIMSQLRSIRIEAALYHLYNSRLSIGEIGDLVGWSDIYQFSRQFKIETGKSPREMRIELFKIK